jgi:uncharacterized membrane protein HdeD (DUF308 family)
MRELMSNLGILLVLGGVISVILTVRAGVNHNTGLLISAILVILGLVVYIIMNRRME